MTIIIRKLFPTEGVVLKFRDLTSTSTIEKNYKFRFLEYAVLSISKGSIEQTKFVQTIGIKRWKKNLLHKTNLRKKQPNRSLGSSLHECLKDTVFLMY